MAAQKNNKNDKAASAKALAEQLRARQDASAKRSRYIFAGVIIAVVVGVVAVVATMLIQSAGAPDRALQEITDNGQGPTKYWAADGSLTISKNGVGEAKAIAGKPTLDIFNDFICPSCGGFENAFGDAIEELVANGDLNVRYHPLGWFNNTSPEYNGKTPTGKSYGYSIRSAAAAFYIGEYAPDKYMDFVKVMYANGNQPQEATNYDVNLGSNDAIAQRAVQAGVPQDIAKAAVTGEAVTSEELRGGNSLQPVAGLTGGPYLKYAFAVGDKVGRSGFNGQQITGTPAIYLNNAKYDYTSGKSIKSVDDFKNDMKNAK